MAEIIEVKKTETKNPILIEGFPGTGMIGILAAQYLRRELKMEFFGYLHSKHLPPVAAIHKGFPLPPVRLYYSDTYDLMVLLSEFIIPPTAIYEVVDEIISWSKKKNISLICSLGGIGAGGDEKKVFGIATTENTIKMLEQNDVFIIDDGATTGVTGVLLSGCYMKKIPAISLLTPSKMAVDLVGAATIVDKLSKIIGIEISTEKLVKEGMKIEKEVKEVVQSARESHKKYKEIEGGQMYR